jgi:hypothetical protein
MKPFFCFRIRAGSGLQNVGSGWAWALYRGFGLLRAWPLLWARGLDCGLCPKTRPARKYGAFFLRRLLGCGLLCLSSFAVWSQLPWRGSEEPIVDLYQQFDVEPAQRWRLTGWPDVFLLHAFVIRIFLVSDPLCLSSSSALHFFPFFSGPPPC